MSSGESTSEGSISGGESETSHSEGQPMETESSTSSDESVEMDHEAMMSEAPGTTETLNKGQRRRVLDAVQKVAESAQDEIQARRQSRSKVPKRLPGPWRIIEIFTWSCMLSQCAFYKGWEAHEPVTLEAGWNLTRKADQDRAHEVSGSSGSRCFDVGMAMRTMVNYAECQHENSYPKESSDAEKVELQEDIPGLHPPSGAVAKEERTSCDYGKSSDLQKLGRHPRSWKLPWVLLGWCLISVW